MEGSSAQDVHVKMEDGLPRLGSGIDDEAISSFVESFLMSHLGGRRKDFPELMGMGDIRHGRPMLPGNDEDVGGGLGVDVAEGDPVFLFCDDVSGHLFTRDFAEDAIHTPPQKFFYNNVLGVFTPKRALSTFAPTSGGLHAPFLPVRSGVRLW